VYAVVRAGCTLLQQAVDREKAVACLQQLRSLLPDVNQGLVAEVQSNDDQDDLGKELTSAVSALRSLALTSSQLLCCLYWGPSAELLIDTLLSGACMQMFTTSCIQTLQSSQPH
jgi:hypothetical protein